MTVPTLAVLVGILVNNRQLDKLVSHTDKCFSGLDGRFGGIDRHFDTLIEVMNVRFAEQKALILRFERTMDARLRRLEEKL
jgi:hypothetical protein